MVSFILALWFVIAQGFHPSVFHSYRIQSTVTSFTISAGHSAPRFFCPADRTQSRSGPPADRNVFDAVPYLQLLKSYAESIWFILILSRSYESIELKKTIEQKKKISNFVLGFTSVTLHIFGVVKCPSVTKETSYFNFF